MLGLSLRRRTRGDVRGVTTSLSPDCLRGPWVASQGIALGSNGLNPSWAFGPPGLYSDEPLNSYTPQAQIAGTTIYDDEHYGNLQPPPYFELQTVNAQTQDCNAQACQPYSGAGYPYCAADNVMEDVYLSQIYGDITTLEAYYNDLDDGYDSSPNPTVKAAYDDWISGVLANDTLSQDESQCPPH